MDRGLIPTIGAVVVAGVAADASVHCVAQTSPGKEEKKEKGEKPPK